MPTYYIDGVAYEAPADANLLQAMLSEHIDMPYFCWHPAMGSVGACRQCAVIQYADEEDTRGRLVMSCMTPVTDGARFSFNAENAALFRDSVIENLMLNHPHDCPVCEEGGECHLQDMTVMVGHRDRRYRGLKTTFKNQYLGPFIGHEMNRCITCYRCVRYYQDYAGGADLAAFGSRDRVFFGRAEPGVLESEFAGNLVEVCPTGVFTDKTLSKHYTRKWDLQSSPTICPHCSLGCNTYTSERYGELRRVHNRYHFEINHYFLCDRGRYGAHFVNSEKRIPQAGIRNREGTYDPVPLGEALAQARALLSGTVVGIGSPRASLEANAALRRLVGPERFANGMSESDQAIHKVILEALQSPLKTPSLADIESYDAILVLGEDTTNHAPRIALAIRQAVRNRGRRRAAQTGISAWHDAAVREITQRDFSPLMLVTPAPDRLDDLASIALRLNPEQILDLAAEISAAVRGEGAGDKASSIAATLKKAARPLIVSGAGLRQEGIVQAAVNIALALTEVNPQTGLSLAAHEVNSVGVALLDNTNSIAGVLAQNPDTVIVLENDLHQRRALRSPGEARIIAIDCLDNATVSASAIVLPAATFAEAEGTFVNNEGRAQRSMAVFTPKGDIAPSYRLLAELAGREASFDAIEAHIGATYPALSAIGACAPDSRYRIEGSKIARMTHRASGRTAMNADVSVHEPKQPVDTESALAFTMEGNQTRAPSSLRAYTWAPGWNSNQSIHKFQSEVGGPDKTGNPGVLLCRERRELKPYTVSAVPLPLVPRPHIYGSEVLSSEAAELATMIPAPYLMMNRASARELGLSDGGGARVKGVDLTVVVAETASACVLYPDLAATLPLREATLADIRPIADWQGPSDPFRPRLIATDRPR